MEKTLFQKIIDREIAATIEFEDDDVIAIRDIAPSAALHLLIITKKAVPSADNINASDYPLVGKVFSVAQLLASKFGVDKSGYRIVTNVNNDAGQTIYHLHFHLLGGEPLGRMNSRGRQGHTDTETGRQGEAGKTSQGQGEASKGGIGETWRGHRSRTAALMDVGIFFAAAIGLAFAFNMMNPKKIDWVKKEFERVALSDEDLKKYSSQDVRTDNDSSSHKDVSSQSANKITDASQSVVNPADASQTEKKLTDVSQSEKRLADASQTEKKNAKFNPEPGVVREINKRQFITLMNAGPYYLIDARTPDAYAKGHIENAHNFYGAEAEARIPDILQSVPKDRVILIYCDGGECELSHHVADVLKNFQYGPVFIYTGGWAEWTK